MIDHVRRPLRLSQSPIRSLFHLLLNSIQFHSIRLNSTVANLKGAQYTAELIHLSIQCTRVFCSVPVLVSNFRPIVLHLSVRLGSVRLTPAPPFHSRQITSVSTIRAATICIEFALYTVCIGEALVHLHNTTVQTLYSFPTF